MLVAKEVQELYRNYLQKLCNFIKVKLSSQLYETVGCVNMQNVWIQGRLRLKVWNGLFLFIFGVSGKTSNIVILFFVQHYFLHCCWLITIFGPKTTNQSVSLSSEYKPHCYSFAALRLLWFFLFFVSILFHDSITKRSLNNIK